MDLSPAGLETTQGQKCYTLMLLHYMTCACSGMNLLQYRQSHGGPNGVSDNEILFQMPLPDLLSLLVQ